MSTEDWLGGIRYRLGLIYANDMTELRYAFSPSERTVVNPSLCNLRL